ncbi:MAG: PKD domain-containing protein [Thermodesulfobacteriota bacterium]|nr:PKD domain-containing protein [Thermodesulfobacteriota bacterium]
MRFLLTFFFLAVLLPGSYSYAAKHTIEIGWTIEDTAGIELAGYRLYGDLQQNRICQTTDPAATTMVCTVDIPGTEATYTLVSYSTDGVESDPSDPFTIVFEELPLGLEAVFDFTTTKGLLAVNFNATASTGSISKYEWNFGDGNKVEYGVSTNHTFPTADTSYKVSLTVMDEKGGTATTTKEITLSPSSGKNQAPVVALDTKPANGNSPLQVTFDAGQSSDPEGSALTYSWDFGDGKTATGSNPSHLYINPNAGTRVYTATVTVTDNQGETSSASSPIFVKGDGTGGNATATANITTNRTSGPAPLIVAFNGTGSTPSEGADSISQYSWVFGDGSTGSGQEVQYTFPDPGEYEIQLIVTDNKGNWAKTTKSITTYAPGEQNITPILIRIYDLLLFKD